MSSLSKEQCFAVIGSLESNNKRDKRKNVSRLLLLLTLPRQAKQYVNTSVRPQSTSVPRA